MAAAAGLAALYLGLHWETQQLVGALVAAFFIFSVDQVSVLPAQRHVTGAGMLIYKVLYMLAGKPKMNPWWCCPNRKPIGARLMGESSGLAPSSTCRHAVLGSCTHFCSSYSIGERDCKQMYAVCRRWRPGGTGAAPGSVERRRRTRLGVG